MSKEVTSGIPLLYASSNAACGCVLIFRQDSGALIGVIRSVLSTPNGIATDIAGNLYVTDFTSGPANWVWIFPPGSIFPTGNPLYDDETPVDVTVATDGTVYVSNSGPTASVYVYAKGSRYWERQLMDVSASQGFGIAVDLRGNVYWGFSTRYGYQIDEFVHGTVKPINLGIALGGAPQSLALDNGNDLLVSRYDAQSSNGAVDIYELPNTLIGEIVKQNVIVTGIALNKFQRLWVGETTYNTITQYSYPGGKLIKTIAPQNFSPIGLAVYPKP